MKKEPDRNPRKALGKGLSALLPSRPSGLASSPQVEGFDQAAAALPSASTLPPDFEEFVSLPLDQIQPNEEQPRTSFDMAKLEELAQSIRANGLLQPITVYKVAEGSYRLIAGERRWRAAQRAGLSQLPALVRNAEQQQRLELALIENIQREDLNPIEIATAFYNLASQHRLSHEQIAERTGKDRSTVTNFMRLLRLTPFVQNALITGQISTGHARALLNLTTEDEQANVCRAIISGGMSVRQTEKVVKELTNEEPKRQTSDQSQNAGAQDSGLDPNIKAALEAMSAALGTKVRLRAKGDARSGTLEIEYYSQEDLDRIYSVIVES